MNHFNHDELHKAVEDGLVTEVKHPVEDYWIYNYTNQVQFGGLWTPTIRQARGLILDNNGDIVALPLPKFHNYSEYDPSEIPLEPFIAYEKKDGVSGILYWDTNDDPWVASRGSFMSPFAVWATHCIRDKYGDEVERLDRGLTYQFEIIYPESRIIVDYGGAEELCLLMIRDKQSGEDIPITEANTGFPLPKVYSFNRTKDLLAYEQSNFEGFVLHFESGFRVKVKQGEYLELHKLLHGVTGRHIWDAMRNGDMELKSVIDVIPDEAYDAVKSIQDHITGEIDRIRKESWEVWQGRPDGEEIDVVNYIKKQDHQPVLFSLFNGMSGKANKYLWDQVKPEVGSVLQVAEGIKKENGNGK